MNEKKRVINPLETSDCHLATKNIFQALASELLENIEDMLPWNYMRSDSASELHFYFMNFFH